ncbi:MAG TPA: hypothetical protein VGB88_00550 [Alphaproteobacteria bacterium]
MIGRTSGSDTPTPDLRAKATEGGVRAGGIDPAAVEAARAVVRARGARYLDSLFADIAALEAELGVVAARGSAAALAAIARRARAMRAHGTTYGYGLVTRLAGSLYDFCGSATGREDEIEVIEMHIQALKAVAGGRMTGDGALAGRDLVHAVEEAVSATAGARG